MGLLGPSEIGFAFHPVHIHYRAGGINLLGLLSFLSSLSSSSSLSYLSAEMLLLVKLMSLFPRIEVSDCRKRPIRFSRLLFQESIESPIGETFRVP